MLRPSYSDLLKKLNKDVKNEGQMIGSRYTIVIAAAKRARQIIDGTPSLIATSKIDKPVSIAVNELYQGKISIIQHNQSDNNNSESEENGSENIYN